MTNKPYLTVDEVAKRFGINPRTVYRLAQGGVLPGFKLGNQWRFSQAILASWVAGKVEDKLSGRKTPPSGAQEKT